MPRQRLKPHEIKIPVNFKVGTGLIDLIDMDSVGYRSRNEWMVEAIEELVEQGGVPTPLAITAREILHDREPCCVRLTGVQLDVVNELCVELGVSRTVWLIDAFLSKLACPDKTG